MPDRILWQGWPEGRSNRLESLSRIGPVAIGAAITAWIFLSFAGINPFSDPFGWIVVVFFALPVAMAAFRILTERPATDQRYTLTQRQLVVESSRGRHAFDLAGLGELTLAMDRSGVGSIRFRRPQTPVPRPVGQLIAFLERYQLTPGRASMPLIERIRQPEHVRGLIADAKRALATNAEPIAPTLSSTSSAPAAPRGLQNIALGIPWWFGAIFLAAGLGFLVLSVATGGPSLVALLPLTFAALGGWVTYSSLARALLTRRLRNAGVATRGTITHLANANIEVNDVPLWVAGYRYRTADGREWTGFTGPAPRSEVSRWAVGDEIDVRYDGARPDRSMALDEA